MDQKLINKIKDLVKEDCFFPVKNLEGFEENRESLALYSECEEQYNKILREANKKDLIKDPEGWEYYLAEWVKKIWDELEEGSRIIIYLIVRQLKDSVESCDNY